MRTIVRVPLTASMFAAALIGSSGTTIAQTPRWEQLAPPPVAGGQAVYDPARHRMLVVTTSTDRDRLYLGGYGGVTVWSLPLAGPPVWTEVLTQGVPNMVKHNGVIYDPVRDRLVMYVGAGTAGAAGSPTWVLDLKVQPPQWSILTTSGTAPQHNTGHSAIYDPVRDRMIVFGGNTGGGFPMSFSRVWALDLATSAWTELFPTGSPQPISSEHTAIYDPNGDRMIVFAGVRRTGMTSTLLDETWSLSLSGTPAWTFLVPGGPVPAARAEHTAVLDPLNQKMIVFGGYESRSDAWELDLTAGNTAAWSMLPEQPAGRFDHFAIYDPIERRMLLYGGEGRIPCFGSKLTDLWALDLDPAPAWQLLGASPTTVPGFNVAAVDSVRARMYLLLGEPFSCTGATWVRTLAGNGEWVELPAIGPGARVEHLALSDPAGDRALVFGGRFASTWLDDTWSFSYASQTWTPIPTGIAPHRRGRMLGVFDHRRRRMIVYGGEWFNGTRYVNFDDTWAFDAASDTWSPLAAGAPGARSNQAGIYDPVRDRVVAFGGSDSTGIKNDVRTLAMSGGVWTTLATAGTAPPRDFGKAVYDPAGDRMLLVLEQLGLDDEELALYALSLSGVPTWSRLTTQRRPQERRGFALVPDYPRGRLVLHGGGFNETWALHLENYLSDVGGEPRSGPVLRLDRVHPNPGPGPVLVTFTLADATPARLEVMDLQGRRVMVRNVPTPRAGTQSVRFGEGHRVAPGLYMLRLTQNGRSATAKVAFVR